MYQIKIKKSAFKELQALPTNAVSRVQEAIDALAQEPRPPGCKKLQGGVGELWRIRIGDYRVIYEIADAVQIVEILKLGHRKDVYS